tara:strand:- start:15830 stop:15934 length:105 start_codon:yes stop_codon:yes gene_type:complete
MTNGDPNLFVIAIIMGVTMSALLCIDPVARVIGL